LAATPAFDVELEVEYETALALSETTDNSAALTEWNGYEADVTLTRTLQTGGWNTLALPFNVEAATLAAINAKLALMGGSMTVKELTSSSFADGKLTLDFATATSMKAGTPYLVKVTPADVNLATMPFTGAEVSKTPVTAETTAVDFVPTLGKTLVTGPAGDESNTQSVLFLTSYDSKSYLIYPSVVNDDTQEASYMKGFRAYFQLKGEAQGVKSYTINFGDGETGIGEIHNSQFTIHNEDGTWYDLQGRRVNKAQKGVFIMNGKKVIK
ncbi:MAG: hypothetical protein J5545_05170, partial [Bacteroidaceae bacterium]|nr:hypothetical protein [Bacteroidaceae bacterium]